MDVRLTINSEHVQRDIEPTTTLLSLLREDLGLTGTKRGCDQGQCGACTVLVGERPVLACLMLAASVRESVITIEGLTSIDGDLHPMQEAFLEHDAYQCGYCTPGQILSAIACLAEGRVSGREQVREALSGNLCRCAAYPNIVDAVLACQQRIANQR